MDLFGGTGNHCYECVSRGCRDASYVDNFGACVAFVTEMLKKLEIEEYVRIHKKNVFSFIKKCDEQFDYIFAGPPYPLPTIDTLPESILSSGRLKTGGLLVMEHNPNHTFVDHPDYQEERHYGKTIFSFFKGR